MSTRYGLGEPDPTWDLAAGSVLVASEKFQAHLQATAGTHPLPRLSILTALSRLADKLGRIQHLDLQQLSSDLDEMLAHTSGCCRPDAADPGPFLELVLVTELSDLHSQGFLGRGRARSTMSFHLAWPERGR